MECGQINCSAKLAIVRIHASLACIEAAHLPCAALHSIRLVVQEAEQRLQVGHVGAVGGRCGGACTSKRKMSLQLQTIASGWRWKNGGSWQVGPEVPARKQVHRCMCVQQVVRHGPDRPSKAESIDEPQARAVPVQAKTHA